MLGVGQVAAAGVGVQRVRYRHQFRGQHATGAGAGPSYVAVTQVMCYQVACVQAVGLEHGGRGEFVARFRGP